MLFNSVNFLIFLPVVFFAYWFVFNKNLKAQNLFIVIASYVFYGWWDWRFLILIILTSLLSFLSGILIYKEGNKKKKRLFSFINIGINIGFLGLFKYYNFFISSFLEAFSDLGVHLNSFTLSIILPVGISFYTFQALSYTIDVYNNKIKPTNDIVAFFAYVSFFPQLVAGPIERANTFLPQFFKSRSFDLAQATDGMRQILWGFFKKIVIADNCGFYVDHIFNNYDSLPASSLVVGAIYFSFQIYGDFSGYSDIAIGVARLFGFNLMKNFNYPYFSRDIAEFWRRWHISLTTWFRDYVYIPLGGSRVSMNKTIRNVFIVFIVSGLWHGANWTFIVWGALNAVLFLPLLVQKKNRTYTNIVAENSRLPSLKETRQIILTFIITTFAWIFFRADTITHSLAYFNNIFSETIISIPYRTGLSMMIPLILILLIVEWVQRKKEHGLAELKMNIYLRWMSYVGICILCLANYKQDQAFIYFQF